MPRRSHPIVTSKWVWITTSMVLFTIAFLLIAISRIGSAPDEHWQMLWVW
jgi:hypothetical protein